MNTLHEEIDLQLFTLQAPDIETFIVESQLYFEKHSNDFYTSKFDMLMDPDDTPLNERRVLANDYKEIGLWIPTESKYNPYKAVVFAWVGDSYPIPEKLQLIYVAPNGHLVIGREILYYNDIKDWDVDDLVTKYI